MAKKTQTVDLEEIEADDKVQIVRPSDLAAELDISPKSLRAFLRREFTRPASEKNTSWVLTEAQVAAARAYFTADEDDEDETDEEDEDDES